MSRQYYDKRLIPAKGSQTAGVRDRGWKVINEEQMRAAEKVFWLKRGMSSPPGVRPLNFARKAGLK